jgi:hypothetical protein
MPHVVFMGVTRLIYVEQAYRLLTTEESYDESVSTDNVHTVEHPGHRTGDVFRIRKHLEFANDTNLHIFGAFARLYDDAGVLQPYLFRRLPLPKNYAAPDASGTCKGRVRVLAGSLAPKG